ncbi:release factor [Rhizodiscina lignyota]|uniref:Release factor n=1 Tax=Rhizodiscina lignyota TaxID=1504668 RepID=A0A9P4IEI5_9PEZI|nr:release factor [Rhizodiscina lignyota]
MLRSAWICSRCLFRAIERPSRRWQRSFRTTTRLSHLSENLLTRARAIASEHATLKKQLEKDYDVQTAKRAGELSRTADLLKELERLKDALRELDNLIRDPTTDNELRSLASDDVSDTNSALETTTQALTNSLVPRHPFEDLPCLIEIRPGAGGSEAALFAGDLLHMYQSYCVNSGLPYSLLKYEDADGVGDPNGSDRQLTEAIMEVNGTGAYGKLRCEAGVHRVQRVPATEAKGRVHTSAASVLVLPSFPDDHASGEDFNDPKSDFFIDLKEVRQEVMRARGAGGQHVNKTESAVRLTHIPTNTTVSIQDSRSQIANRDKAWRLLRSRIAQIRREAREDEMRDMKRSVVGVAKVGRGDKIRTYNFQQQRVTDHRSGFSIHSLEDAIEGGSSLEQVMDSVRKWMIDQEVAQLVAIESNNT